jgi:hypothetical protein
MKRAPATPAAATGPGCHTPTGQREAKENPTRIPDPAAPKRGCAPVPPPRGRPPAPGHPRRQQNHAPEADPVKPRRDPSDTPLAPSPYADLPPWLSHNLTPTNPGPRNCWTTPDPPPGEMLAAPLDASKDGESGGREPYPCPGSGRHPRRPA